MAHLTPWSRDTKNKKTYPSLQRSMQTDVVIVGGGMAGIISAYLLSKEGKKVVVLEKNKIGDGATVLTTAFLTASLDTDFVDLIKINGLKKAREIIASHKEAIDVIEKIIKKEKIECDFTRCSNYIYANKKDEMKYLEKEWKAAVSLGLSAVLKKDTNAFGFVNAGYIEIKNQAKFHPLKFLKALAEIAVANGVKIFESTEVKKVISNKDGGVEVETGKAIVFASWALVTTYEPFNKPLRLYFKKAFYTSYVFEIEVPDMKLKEGTYEDTYNPYHYLRIDKIPKGNRLIIGGEDHRSDVPASPAKSFNALKKYLVSILPKAKYTIVEKWKGPILEPVDGLASIGPLDKENILYAMAFSGNGMTYSAIAARLFVDYVLGRKNSLQEIYRANRFPGIKALLTKGKDYTEELIKGAIKNTLQNK
jgi:glycine/D-amino acid oxidase-like deaminating enzyme